MQWKVELINEIENGLKLEPVVYSKKKLKNYQRVIVNGKFDFENQIFLYNLNENGVPGLDIITPLMVNSGDYLLVNRGWIPKELKNQNKINKTNTKIIKGILKQINKANIFKPKNDMTNNLWFSINLKDFRIITGKNYPSYVLIQENNDIPVISKKNINADLPNNHLKYAITWYSVSVSIIICFLYFRRRNEIF